MRPQKPTAAPVVTGAVLWNTLCTVTSGEGLYLPAPPFSAPTRLWADSKTLQEPPSALQAL